MENKQKNIDESLFLKVLEDRADDLEISRFNEWCNQSAENAELFAEFKKAHQLSSFDNHSTRSNWAQVVNKLETGYNVPDYIELPEAKSSGKTIRFRSLLRVAAMVTLIVGVSFLFKYIGFSSEQIIVSGNELTNNEPYQMADGSLIYLHGDSEIMFLEDFGTNSREVTLIGEAFFEIERNEKLPFVIKSNQTAIKVLGTSFNVFSDVSEQVEVSVVTGVVEFSTNKSNQVKLVAGEQGTFIPELGNIRTSGISNQNFQSWKTGILTFKETQMKEAFDVLGRHYAKKFLFKDFDEVLPTITTTFNNQPIESVLEELNLLLNTKCAIKNDTIIFEPDI